MLRATDMRRKISSELKGKSEAEQIRIIEGYVRDWPPNVRGEYIEIRRHLVRRLEKLRTASRVKASTGGSSSDPFVVARSGHLTAALVGLPNVGKSYVFHRLGGDGATIADYPFSTAIPAVHLAALDNLTIQIVDLPPVVEDTVSSLPYGAKLPRMLALADVLCIVLDASGDVEYQEIVLSEELGSMGVEPDDVASLVLVNRAEEAPSIRRRPESTPASPPGSVLAGTRVSLRSERDFDDLLANIARAEWLSRRVRQTARPDAGRGGQAVGGALRDSRGPGNNRPQGPGAAADRRPGLGRVGQAARPDCVHRAPALRRRRRRAAGPLGTRESRALRVEVWSAPVVRFPPVSGSARNRRLKSRTWTLWSSCCHPPT